LVALRRVSLAELPPFLFVVWVVAMIVRVHLPYLAKPSEQSIDEGYLIAIGQLMLHGRMLPFVDAVAHTGPVFMYSGALIAAFGQFSWLPIRVAALLAFVLCSLLAFACGRRAGRPLAGAIASAAVPFFISLRMEYDSVAFNAELPAMVFALASFYAALRAFYRDAVSTSWLCVAGLLTSCAAMSKQVAVLLVAPIAGYVLLQLLVREAGRRRTRLLCLYAGSALAPALLFLVRLAAAGALADAYYYLVTYNSGPYMFPFRESSIASSYAKWLLARPLELAACALAIAWGFTQPLVTREGSWLRSLQRSGFELTVAAMALGGIIAARASMRDFDHYYQMAVPGFALLLGCLIERAAPNARTLHRALLLLPLVLIGEVVWAGRSQSLLAWSTQHMTLTNIDAAYEEPPMCAFIREHSAPEDRLFVWGFRAQLHVSCARLPASRFVYSTFVSGFVPTADLSTEVENTLVRPGAREQLIDDLERTRPPIIVDAARTMGMRSFHRYPQLQRYVVDHYHLASTVGGDQVWLRRDAQGQAAR
jgi:hypothetical protein